MSATIIPAGRSTARRNTQAWIDRSARRLIRSRLAALRHGRLTVIEEGKRSLFGTLDEAYPVAATVTVIDPSFWRRMLLGGDVAAGEAYIEGAWQCDDLTALTRILVRNRDILLSLDRGLSRLGGIVNRLYHRLRRNSRTGSRDNIAAHYDLGNDFYRLFLDEAMVYSCAYFENENMDLDQASRAKLERICSKLRLRGDHHLLEIGSGWGGLALYAARTRGCRVTTTTISKEQYEYTRSLVEREGLCDRITVLNLDYRDLEGRFDRIVSIEMVEAVGADYIDLFFERCSRLLAPDGLMVLQGITIDERLYRRATRSVDFIQRYVFPGSHLPSISSLTGAVGRATDMRLVHLEEIGPHYAKTLRAWRRRFMVRLDEVRAAGFPDSFIRLWEYYLCYCEGGFMERSVGDVQMVLAKPLCRDDSNLVVAALPAAASRAAC
jgi:cyclopropane-fatty-acyl-phospholipid synthase